jgi:hypothetical protein
VIIDLIELGDGIESAFDYLKYTSVFWLILVNVRTDLIDQTFEHNGIIFPSSQIQTVFELQSKCSFLPNGMTTVRRKLHS